MLCDNCQQTIREDSLFCEHCGARVEQTAPPAEPLQPEGQAPLGRTAEPLPIRQEPSQRLCASCRRPVREGDAFCRACGAPQPGGAVTPAPGPRQPPAAAAGTGLSRRAFVAVLVAAAALLVVAGACVALFAMPKLFPGDQAVVATAEPTPSPAPAASAGSTAVAQAQSYIDSGEYSRALEALKDVSPSDPDYDRAKSLAEEAGSLYVTQALDRVDGFIASNRFADAVKLLQDAQLAVPGDDRLAEKLDECDSAAGAFREAALEQAKGLWGDSQYDAAIQALGDALAALPGDEALLAAKEDYSSREQSVSLFDFEPAWTDIQHPDLVVWDNLARTDVKDNNYERGIYFQYMNYKNGVSRTSTLAYNLNGEYKRLTGAFGPDSTCSLARHPNYNKQSYFAMLNVYGDGRLLLQTPKVRGGSDSVTLNVDISGVNELKLEIVCYVIDPNLFDIMLVR